MWQVAQAWLPGFGMWPAGSEPLFQFAVVWQPLQSPVSMVPRGVIGGRSCSAGTGRAHVQAARGRRMAGVASGGHEGMRGLRHVHGPEGAGRIRRRLVAGTAIGAGQIRNVRGRAARRR